VTWSFEADFGLALTTKKKDLALSITKSLNNSEFTVLLILIILFTTIFFCYALLRLCMTVARPRPEGDEAAGRPPMLGLGGYAIPRVPIRVVLARDEEAAGIESETTKLRPPAYGLWRESVVSGQTFLVSFFLPRSLTNDGGRPELDR